MKLILYLIILFYSINSYAERTLLIHDLNKIKFNRENDNTAEGIAKKKYDVDKIIVSNKFIHFEVSGDSLCAIPISALISDEIKYNRCCGKISPEEEEAKKEIENMYSNFTDFKIFCLMNDNQLVSFIIEGHTLIHGKKGYASMSKIINMQNYPKPEEPVIEKSINDLAGTIWKWFVKGLKK